MKSKKDSDKPNVTQKTAFDKATIGEQIKYWRSRSHISQLDLALECDSSSRHLSFIETGRAHPSRQLLLDLTKAMQVPLRAQNSLLISAGYSPIYEETGISEPEMEQMRKMLGMMIKKNDPFPSMLIDRHWNIVESNLAFRRMCETFAHNRELLEQEPVNLLRAFLNPDCLGRSVMNYKDMYTTMLNRARRFINVMGNDSESQALLEELLSYRPKDAKEIDEDLPHLVMPLNLKKGDLELRLFTMVATMGAPLNITLQEIQLEFALPVDDASNILLHELVQ